MCWMLACLKNILRTPILAALDFLGEMSLRLSRRCHRTLAELRPETVLDIRAAWLAVKDGGILALQSRSTAVHSNVCRYEIRNSQASLTLCVTEGLAVVRLAISARGRTGHIQVDFAGCAVLAWMVGYASADRPMTEWETEWANMILEEAKKACGLP